MNDHTKFPVPGKPASGDSLLERAVGNAGLGDFSAPPVPAGLPPERKKRPARRPEPAPPAIRAEDVELVEEVAFVEPAPAPVPEAVMPIAGPEPQPEPTPVVEQSEPEPFEPAPEPAPDVEEEPEPVRFSGEVHPVDRKHLAEQALIVPDGKVTTLLEEFRIIKRQVLVQAADLRRRDNDAAAQRVLVSSPHPGEGKTYCSLNLALSIAAEKESEVLLVDADFAKPSVLEALGLPDGPGLMDALADPGLDVAGMVMKTDIPGLWVLPAGNRTNSDSEYLASSRTRKVLDRLTEGAPQRIVLFDTPPALAASTASELAKYVAQVLMVVRADQTGQGALEDAVSLLSACPNIQLLLNAVHFSPSGRSFGTYYGYGG